MCTFNSQFLIYGALTGLSNRLNFAQGDIIILTKKPWKELRFLTRMDMVILASIKMMIPRMSNTPNIIGAKT